MFAYGFHKKPMKEFLYVQKEGITTETALMKFIELGLAHAKDKLGE